MLKQLLNKKWGWLILVVILVVVNILLSFFHFRVDLTGEKRYTISKPTNNLIKNLDDVVDITVFLDGDMPAGFRKLAGSADDMLQSFKAISPNLVRYRFIRPGEGLADTAKAALYDSLRRMGINPTNVKAQTKQGEGMEETLVFPGAIVKYADREIGIDFLQGQSSLDGINSLNNAESLLEYKFADAIHKITADTIPMIAYLTGNGEPVDYRVYDLIENALRPNYGFRILPIDSVPVIPNLFNAILIVKPVHRFSEQQKLKIDQYIMNGGNVIWAVDNLYASLDSLQRSQGEFIAFDMGLNLEDQLFKYGVRINQDLVQDLQSDKIPSVIGSMGDKPQIEVLPWPYFPLLRNVSGNAIAKNLDYVLSQFPQSIDTVKAPGITKTILLSTSPESRILPSPAKVEWASIRTQDDLNTFNKGNLPVVVLLEGRFQSIFANRISSAMADTLARLYGTPFKPMADKPGKMIVAADGDLLLNAVTQNEGPLQMGMNSYTKQQYANREFLLNSIEALVDNSGILETRAKDYTLRLLDKTKVEESKNYWQILNILVPVILIIMAVGIYQYIRRTAFAQVLK
ncbi:gliding motility-associated ABC transporter substrate-binding protein GldG [Pollutibacter soli]|uniref:gliding motility-associated ABC transporter substrate-binding protein GldG n=1 Tax=Pollutibacter soli TaxID=3034157 RepID=UPI003014123B